MASLPHLADEILENTFMSGLMPRIRAEVECWELIRLVKMMKMAQQVKNKELIWSKTGNHKVEKSLDRNKINGTAINPKHMFPVVTKEIMKAIDPILMKILTLRGVSDQITERRNVQEIIECGIQI